MSLVVATSIDSVIGAWNTSGRGLNATVNALGELAEVMRSADVFRHGATGPVKVEVEGPKRYTRLIRTLETAAPYPLLSGTRVALQSVDQI